MEVRDLVFLNRNDKRMPGTLRVPSVAPKGTMIVLHGLAAWKDLSTVVTIAEGGVAAGYQAVTFDGADCLRGPDATFARSTTTGFINDTEDVIDAVRKSDWFVPPLVLAGHSLGALSAVRIERLHPGTATRLLLVAPATSWFSDRRTKFLQKARYTAGVISRTTRLEKETGEKYFFPLSWRWVLDFFQYDTRKDAPHITVPVLVVSAGDDLVVAGPEIHADLVRRFPHAEHHVIPGASHLFYEHEQELAGIVATWLSSS